MTNNVIIRCALVLALASTGARIDAQQSTYHDIAIPAAANATYPASPETVADMKNFQRTTELRKHAWALFTGITARVNQNDRASDPIWTTWFTRREALGQGCPEPPTNRTSPRFEFELPMEIVAKFAARVPILDRNRQQEQVEAAKAFFSDPSQAVTSVVLYNKSACRHIQDLRLFKPEVLDDKLKQFASQDAPPEEMNVNEFPPGSVVIKSSWLRIDGAGGKVCLWSPSDPSVSTVCSQRGMHEIRVAPSAPTQPCTRVPNQPILTSCFYSIPVTKRNFATLSRSMTVQPGDVLVLVGLHVITKEAPDWIWSTFWWQTEPDSGKFAADRPDRLLDDPWHNYVMDSTLSMETPREAESVVSSVPNAEKCKSRASANAKICYNPYLEGNLEQGSLSNCMNCHKQATYQRIFPNPSGTPQRGYLGSDAGCFADKEHPVMRVDYLWTLSPLPQNGQLENFFKALLNAMNLDLNLNFRY